MHILDHVGSYLDAHHLAVGDTVVLGKAGGSVVIGAKRLLPSTGVTADRARRKSPRPSAPAEEAPCCPDSTMCCAPDNYAGDDVVQDDLTALKDVDGIVVEMAHNFLLPDDGPGPDVLAPAAQPVPCARDDNGL